MDFRAKEKKAAVCLRLRIFLLLLILLFGLTACGKQTQSQSLNLPDISDLSGNFFITVLAVGDASAAIVQADGDYMLVDVGDKDDTDKIAALLSGLGIDELTAVVFSHGHSDHVGGYQALADYEIETAYISPQSYDSETYSQALSLLSQQAVEIKVPDPGDSFYLGDALVQFFGPVADEYQDLNDSSLVVKISYGDTSFILPGDMEGKAADQMLATFSETSLDCDVLVAAHHGSNNDGANSYRLLRALSPSCVIISSAGSQSEYGFPHDEVLSRLADLGAAVYRTDLQGDISLISDGQNISVRAEDVSVELPLAAAEANDEAGYIGNVNSKKFHLPSCSGLPAEKNRIYFAERSEAINSGYEPCKICQP